MLGVIAGFAACSFAVYGMCTKSDENEICTYKELKPLMGDGVRLSKNVRLSVKNSNEHIIMIAPSGGGKSRRFLAHNINDLQNCSLVVTDPSCELERMCNPKKKKYIFNPFSDKTVGYDPLFNCRNEFEVRKIASVILMNGMNATSNNSGKNNQEEWVRMAIPLLSSYMLMNYYTKKFNFADLVKNICTMPIVSKIERDENGKITRIYPSIELDIRQSKVESAITEFDSFLQVMGAMQTLSSIRIVMNTCLQLFLDANAKKILTRPMLDMTKLRKEESIIYIQIPERHSKYFSPLVATFMNQLFDILLDNQGLQCYFLLDEFCNIGKFDDIQTLLSTCRKSDIGIITAIQNIIQLKALYGELEGKNINELFKTILVCAGLKNESAEYVSELLGTAEYKENNTTKTKPLMTPAEVRMMNEDDILIISKNKRPVIDKLLYIMEG